MSKDFTKIQSGVGAVFSGIPAKKVTSDPPELEGVKESVMVPTPKLKSPRAKKPAKDPEQPDGNPYTFMPRVKWPLQPKAKPFIIATPEGYADITTGINFRASLALEATLEEHCRAIGANKSEWLREAVAVLLEREQADLGKLK